jgi:hypothetical protein
VDHTSDNGGADTELYLLRIWKGRSGDGTHSLHGKLQHAVSGEAYTFRGLQALAELLAPMFGEKDVGQLQTEASKSPDASAG